jgi:hypothetical protein
MNAIKLCITLLVSVVMAVSVASHSEAATKAGEIKIATTGKEFLVQMQTDQTMKKCTYDSGTAKFSCVDFTSAGPNFLYQGAVDIAGNNLSDAVFLNISQGDKGDVTFWPDFAKSQAVTPRQVRTLWRVDTVGDMDGDGVGDLVWRFTGQTPNLDDTGVSYVWFMNRDGTVAQVRKRGGAPLSWTLLGSSDVNNDGAADMVYVSPANAIRVLAATPNRTCANFSAGSLDPSYTALSVADFTFAGVPDVMARNSTTGAVRLTTLNASGIALPAYTGAPDDPNASCTSTSVAIPQVLVRDIPSDPTWQFYATGDFNNDGIIDIVWKKPDGNLALWTMSPGGNAPIVNNNAGIAPLGYVGLAQSGTRTNNAESVTYAIWTAGYPYLVTKNGVTKVINKTSFVNANSEFSYFNCWPAFAQ